MTINRPRPPCWFSPEAKAAWRRVLDGMISAGRWDLLYHASLALLCVSYGHWLQAERKSRDPGPGQALYRGLARDQLDRVKVLLEEFGTTQAERSEVMGWLAGDALDELLQGLLFTR